MILDGEKGFFSCESKAPSKRLISGLRSSVNSHLEPIMSPTKDSQF